MDPIPLPAPVWVFKGLQILILSLHFTAIHLLLGGLLIATLWNYWGHRKRQEVMIEASGLMSNQFTIIMTYLINLGVPPLLFAQVLYGRAFYTSSILIGVYWIGVVFLVMAIYYILYLMNKRSDLGKGWWGWALIALVLGALVANIYNRNMTLMIRPEVWAGMYRGDPHGLTLPPHDPTVFPRWLYMMAGSIGITGIGLLVISAGRGRADALRHFLIRVGGALALVFIPAQLGAGLHAFRAQPDAVQQAVLTVPFYHAGAGVWWVAGTLTALLGLMALLKPSLVKIPFRILVAVTAVVLVAGGVVVRDGIRDLTLKGKGFDVWAQPVFVNPWLIGVFVATLIIGVIVMIWIGLVVSRASSPTTGGNRG